MKELCIEQKAKRYDEAIKRLEDIMTGKCPKTFMFTKGLFDYIFPELAESEEEMIRKDIVEAVELHKDFTQGRKERIYAWFEKQGEKKHTAEEVLIKAGLKPYKDGDQWCVLLGDNIQEGICGFGNTIEDALYAFLKDLIASLSEQKPTDKVEPKFKAGDWVVYECGEETSTLQIARIFGKTYVFSDESTLNVVDEDSLRLWTIQDAKDGDVLCTYECGKPKIVFILKGAPEKPYVLGYHCFYNIMYPHFEFDSEKGCLAPNEEDVKPATKEQRDTLMKAMADAGYTFDFEKKELKKIVAPKFEVGDTMRTLQEAKDGFTDGMPVVVSIDEEYYHCTNELIAIKDQDDYEYPPINRIQKPYWSEMDKINLEKAIWYVENPAPMVVKDSMLVDWLKSIKDRVQPKQQGWSEEDNEHIKSIISTIECSKAQFPNAPAVLEAYNSDLIWLKSLRPQDWWKPSDEEIRVVARLRHCLLEDVRGNDVVILDNLLEQLKAL